MKILKKIESSEQSLAEILPRGANHGINFMALEAAPRYQPEQATDELPYQTIEPFWPKYGHYDSPLAE